MGFVHFIMNGIIQLVLGWFLERQYGFWRIAFIYIMCGGEVKRKEEEETGKRNEQSIQLVLGLVLSLSNFISSSFL